VRRLPRPRRRGHEGHDRAEPGRRVPPVPRERLRGEHDLRGRRREQRHDVASYVASVAGTKPAGSGAPTTTTEPSGGGGGGGNPLAQGKEIFASAGCNSCHTLADAGATGTVGPNLDELKPSAAAAEEQVRNGGGGMPPYKGQLSEEQIKAVAEYVAEVAGK
jgi:mono/diheme cytochrome c family protein